jgi:hypothetical protein
MPFTSDMLSKTHERIETKKRSLDEIKCPDSIYAYVVMRNRYATFNEAP